MSSDSKAKIMREGERYVQQGKLALAIAEFLKIIRDDPEDVLTLNTIGDLYLRQGKITDANRIFLQVAETYTRTNFLLKAIAVYKKIISTEPNHLEVNMQLASLYARQGMNVDARNQYLFIAEMCAKEGKTKESLDAYEKVAEIDPLNSPVQLKLAESYSSQDLNDKAYLFFAGAGRAQMKAGDVSAAMWSFRRALAINLTSPDALKGFLETALQVGDLREALKLVKDSASDATDDAALQELLGRAYQAAGDLDRADRCFHALVKADESRYTYLLPLSEAFLSAGDPDRALRTLDAVMPILICRREPEKLIDAYNLILSKHPDHLPTLGKLAEILSAASEEQKHLETLERMASLYGSSGRPNEALEALEKILEVKPDSEKHQRQHMQVFEQAFPEMPYTSPRSVREANRREGQNTFAPMSSPPVADQAEEDSAQTTLVEIDLLLNYGMKEKALQLLRALESRIPADKEVHRRLCSFHKDASDYRSASEQYVLLSVLQRNAGELDEAQKSWDEAMKLAPEFANSNLDVARFAEEHGIMVETPQAPAAPAKEQAGNLEVDLSGDLSEIFFKDEEATTPEEQIAIDPPDLVADEYMQGVRQSSTPESIEEQLQEVDFYIRLGFNDEARTKLDEIAATNPGHPQLVSRYSQLGREPAGASEVPTFAAPGRVSDPVQPERVTGKETPKFQDLDMPGDGREAIPLAGSDLHDMNQVTAPARGDENGWTGVEDQQSIEPPRIEEDPCLPNPSPQRTSDSIPPAERQVPETPPNAMFADLIAEVNSLTTQEIAREDFETHFSLGTAFREMGLVEDAIREFQNAVKAMNSERFPKEFIQCCGMLSTCFLEKGMPRSAIRWCQTGLDVKQISSHEAMALRYDMGVAHAAAGESERALECFGMIFSVDPTYRDVAQRIDDLKSGLERHAL